MSTKQETLPKFAFGSRVRVKKGVTTFNHSDMPLGGWCGKVYQTSGTICLVHWSEATLEAIHSIHRERWQRDGMDCRAVWLQERALEADLGGPLCIEQTKDKIQCVR
jgi:hypothetical protein